MLHRSLPIAFAALSLALPAIAGEPAAWPVDCFNDERPPRTDFEPPPPGGAADLFRISDSDVKRVLDEIAAAERRRIAARDASAAQAPRPTN